MEQILAQNGSPLYIYRLSAIDDQLKKLQYLFSNMMQVAYSLKANPFSEVVKHISTRVKYADIVSEGEINQALSNGFEAQNLLYIGPVKTEMEIEKALSLGVVNFVCESLEETIEINRISSACKKQSNIILRVNPVLPNRKAGIQMTGKTSKFGIDESKLIPVIQSIQQMPSLHLIGLHAYIGTQILDAVNITENLEHMMKLTLFCEECSNISLPYLGFGGGYGIPYFKNEKPLDIEFLKSEFKKLFRQYPAFQKKQVVSEAGRFIVGPCGDYVVRVLRVKESPDSDFVITDGGLHQHAAACGIGRFVRQTFPVYILKETLTENNRTYEITGRLCTSTDSFGLYRLLPEIKKNDIIVIPNSGAYCYSMSPLNFLSFPLPKEIVL